MTDNGEIKINKRKIRSVGSDPLRSAKVADLIYVRSDSPGYTRSKKGKSFIYFDEKKRIKNKSELERIRKLVLPPAWKNVWICRRKNGHLQATGIDAAGRKQYKYHQGWNLIRSQTKYYRLYEFGKKLPLLRAEIRRNLSLPGFEKKKVISALLDVQEKTNIRVGNLFYEKHYGSFGMTTMKNRHAKVNGKTIGFDFVGKKGIRHHVTLSNKKLAKIIKGCKEIPGKQLFEYIDEEGAVHRIDSGMVNEFIQKVTGGDFTAKDIRTWSGSVKALLALKKIGGYESEPEMKEKLKSMYESVAKDLGNTTAVCKKYYIHPVITNLYEKNKLDKYLSRLKLSTAPVRGKSGLTSEEKVLMKILNHNS